MLAHETAIAAGGTTVAVLGAKASAGDERKEWQRQVFDRAPDRAITLSPYAPDDEYRPGHFSERNRYIAGCADAVVVVAARIDSGCSHIARAARELKIDLWFRLDGTPRTELGYKVVSTGNGFVLKPWRGMAEVLERIAERRARREANRQKDLPLPEPMALGPIEQAIVDAGGPISLDQAARTLKLPIGDLLAEAAELELAGRISLAGGVLSLPRTS
jgi:predicted Rossmann fold nucleotide-binding protein DprA/Smf involved in DNA uptake